MKRNATLVASVYRIKDKIGALRWMTSLPKAKQTTYELDHILDNMLKGDLLVWNSEGGFRLYMK